MSLHTWNVRGINTPNKINDVFKLLTKFKPTIVIVCLVENKLNEENLSIF